MAEDWTKGWLCKGCGEALGAVGTGQQILEGNTDAGGDFIRCLNCGGKHYYEMDKQSMAIFRRFEPDTRILYRLRRELGLLGPLN